MLAQELCTREKILARNLYRIGAIDFGAFKLKHHETHPDDPLSPIYIDLRLVRSDPQVRNEVIEAYMWAMRFLRPVVIADVPTASSALVGILADRDNLSMITPREPKTYGTESSIDGIYTPGDEVILIDDLISYADSKLASIAILENAGLIVKDIVVLIDRQQGGSKLLEEKGYTVHSVFTISRLLDFYEKEKFITHDQYTLTKAYLGI